MGDPVVGDSVHYLARGSADGRFPPVCRHAVVTEVDFVQHFDNAGLAVLNPTGLFFHPLADSGGCAHDEERKVPGSWHRPH